MALSVRQIHLGLPARFSGMERRFWLICIYLGIKRIEWRFRSELVCVEPNDVYGTVSFELSDLSQTWQTVSQSAVWVAMCHQHTAPSARSLFNKDRLCFETLPLSVGFSPVFVLSPPLLSFPFLYSAQWRTCDAKIRTRCWKALKRKNDRFVLSLGAVQICSFLWKVCFRSWSLLIKPLNLYKCTYNVNSWQPLGVSQGMSTCDFQKPLFNMLKYIMLPCKRVRYQWLDLRRLSFTLNASCRNQDLRYVSAIMWDVRGKIANVKLVMWLERSLAGEARAVVNKPPLLMCKWRWWRRHRLDMNNFNPASLPQS